MRGHGALELGEGAPTNCIIIRPGATVVSIDSVSARLSRERRR